MLEGILIVGLAVFALIALFVWWVLDIDVADIVGTVGAPVAGAAIIYWYGTLISWTVGIVLLLIGAFGLYYFFKRRRKPSPGM